MKTLKQTIDEEAGENTHKRTGFMKEACMDDAKMKQGLWQPMDTLPIVARIFAQRCPAVAHFLIKIFLAIAGTKEVTK